MKPMQPMPIFVMDEDSVARITCDWASHAHIPWTPIDVNYADGRFYRMYGRTR